MREYVGFDVSKEETAFCVKDAAGKVLARGKVRWSHFVGQFGSAVKVYSVV